MLYILLRAVKMNQQINFKLGVTNGTMYWLLCAPTMDEIHRMDYPLMEHARRMIDERQCTIFELCILRPDGMLQIRCVTKMKDTDIDQNRTLKMIRSIDNNVKKTITFSDVILERELRIDYHIWEEICDRIIIVEEVYVFLVSHRR